MSDLFLWLLLPIWHGKASLFLHSFFGRNKCMCSSSHALRYGCVQSKNFLPRMMGTPFVLVALTRLNVSEPKQWATWSLRTGINFLFWGEKESNTLVFLLNQFWTHFYSWCKVHLKNQKFLFAFKTFFEEIERFLSYQICSFTRNLELVRVWWIRKETSLF